MAKLLSDDDVRERIRENIREQGCTQAAYAEQHGYTQSDMSLFMAGKITCPPRIFVPEGLIRKVYYEEPDE